MEKSLPRYIWTHTRGQQLWILVIVALSMVPYFLSFDLPKQIINGPIQGEGFETPEATQRTLHIAFDLPGIGPVELFPGFEVDRMGMLVVLTLIFLLLVVINGLFKYYINTYKGRLGERMLRRIRFELVDRLLRFPPAQFKRVKPAEIATMVKDEVEPLGGFIGDAFVQPMLLGGQALTALVFIMVQNFWLGLIAAGIVAIQGYIIPKMRRRLIRLGRERQLTARELSGRVGEIVDGIASVHTHDTSNYERADISARLGRIFKIRYDLYQWKFLVKFINNFLAQVTPFLFYLVGGILVIRGQLDVGQLVAVIAAYKDLPGPLKELIDWDQARQDVQVKYAQVVEQFDLDDMLDPRLQALVAQEAEGLGEPISVVNLTVVDDGGNRLLERTSLEIKPGEAVALVSTPGGGGEALAEALAGLVRPETGKITIGSKELHGLPEAVTGRRISYAASDANMFQGTLRDNLFYSLKHAPLVPAAYQGDKAAHREWEIAEARKAGNPDHDIHDDWIDYKAAGATGPDDIYMAVLPVLDAVALSRDILDLGLRSSINRERHAVLAGRIVEIRDALQARIQEEGLTDLVVPFEPGAYNPEATVAENLLFGAATGPELADKALSVNPYFRSVLQDTGLDQPLFAMGLEIAQNVVELFRDLPPDHPFFQQLTFMSADELPDYQALLQRLRGRDFAAASEAERSRLIALSFAYVEPRHRFGLLDDALMARIVDARTQFHANLPEELKGAIERYDPERYNTAASLLDNILFGRIGHKHAGGAERIRGIIGEILRELELFDDVVGIGLEYNAGVGGKRLTAGQRQKLNLARALLKRADILILNRPLSALDGRVQEDISRNVLEVARRGDARPTIVWALASPGVGRLFERVVVFDRGSLAEQGTYDALAAGNGIFKGLIS